jgi:UDP-N-acetylglucosamine 2-epimerase
MIGLQMGARIIITDSGGMQKEAYWARTPCVTLTEDTEWVDLVNIGVNKLVGSSCDKIMDGISQFEEKDVFENVTFTIYGDGKASEKIIDTIYRESFI